MGNFQDVAHTATHAIMKYRPVTTHSVEGNAVFLQDGWRYQRHLVAKKGIAALGAAREETCRDGEGTNTGY